MRGFTCDPYEVLEIGRDATHREVKRVYRRLAMKFHPDHNPGTPEAAERFKKVQAAYESLTGRRKPGRISQTAFYHRRYPPSIFENEHPFFGFYRAVKNHFGQTHNSHKDSGESEESNV